MLTLHPRPHILRHVQPQPLHLLDVDPVVLNLPERFELGFRVERVGLVGGGGVGAAVGGFGGCYMVHGEEGIEREEGEG
jgi:hypothetical protein